MKKMLVVALLIPILFGCVKDEVEEVEKEVEINQSLNSSYVELPSDWKIYNNEKYEYSFIYRTGKKLNDDDDSLIFVERWSNSQNYTEFEVEVQDANKADLKDFTNDIWQSYKNKEETLEITDIEDTLIDRIKGYQFTVKTELIKDGPFEKHIYTILRNNDYDYIIKSLTGDAYINICLESFAFELGTMKSQAEKLRANSLNTSLWKSYENTKYGYSFMLPSNGRVGGSYSANANNAPKISIAVKNIREDGNGRYLNDYDSIIIEAQDSKGFPEEYAQYMRLDLEEFANYLWEFNQNDEEDVKKGKQVGPLTEASVDGRKAYKFVLNKSFTSPGGGGLLDKETVCIMTNDGTYNYIIKSEVDNPYLKEILNSFKYL